MSAIAPTYRKTGFSLRPIAYARTEFPQKFGIPRQAGRVGQLRARIVFEPEFASEQAVRGIAGFSHLWLIWQFSEVPERDGFAPMVRPPRLEGNERIGVFATRSPFRPNRLGLSSVRLEAVKAGELVVAGADLLDGTPIFDVKPYVREDVHEDARFGFTQKAKATYEVIIDPQITASLPSAYVDKLTAVLAEYPLPAYHSDPERIYGFTFGGYEIKFRVDGVVRVLSVTRI